jgi:translocator protein
MKSATASYATAALAVFVTATAGSYFTRPQGPWYECIKPPASPPAAAFPIAWTTLYILMAIALGRSLLSSNALYLAAFAYNLVLNAAWCYVYFVEKRPLDALVLIAALLASIVYLVVASKDALVPWLLLPYLAWVSFATFLNAQSVQKAGRCEAERKK